MRQPAPNTVSSHLRLPRPPRIRSPRRSLLEAAFFLFLALASTWPLARHAHDHLPLGMEEAATVPLFNLWTVWWNAERAANGYEGYWDAPIFHPAKKAFTFSEPMSLTVLAAPVVFLGDNRILAYNCLLLFALGMNGWAACRLLRRLPHHPALPWLGGIMIALLPLVHSWLGVLQLVPVFGILLTILALHRFARRPDAARGLFLGMALALTYLLCSYYGLILAPPLAASSFWLLGRHAFRGKTWLNLLPGALLCLLVCLPVIAAQQQSLPAAGMQHDIGYLAQLSATPADYLAPPWKPLFPRFPDHDGAFRLCPGALKMALALLGAIAGIIMPGWRRWTAFCLSMAGFSFLLSMGPLLQIGELRPYLLLVDYLPGVAQVRNVFRFAIITDIMIVLLAVMALQAAVTYCCRFPGRVYQTFLGTAVIAAGILAAVEILPVPQRFHKPPDFAANQSWIEWLRESTPERCVIACIPFPLKPDVASYQQEAEWMYWQTFHRRRMINGYSGHFPDTFRKLKWPMAQFPAAETISMLLETGVEYCVVKSDSPQGRFVRSAYRRDPRIEAVFHDRRAGVDIYRLHAGR